ncbi:hypothetical protein P8831_15710 [Priestia megaterium]|uniref:hypothetical protein n=1 Tax=Priestia megaterium TaxID=1404 RepID=UPI002D808EDC|nr:hypothetical protein [Priestia megaterium]MEB4870172.1 hypothetical protein [Priestia megaterium]
MLEKIFLNTKMNDVLQEVNLELLPNEMSNHDLVNWIVGFSSYSKEMQKHTPENIDNYNILYTSEVNGLVQNSIQSSITYYLAALFHLGRQWKTSLTAINLIEQALQEQNLKQTVYENRSLFIHALEDLEYNYLLKNLDYEIEKVMKKILLETLKDHQSKVRIAEFGWKIWIQEIKDYRKLLGSSLKFLQASTFPYSRNKVDHSLVAKFVDVLTDLVTTDFLNKRLYSVLKDECGINFKKSIGKSATQDIFHFTIILHQLLDNLEDREYYYKNFLYKHINRLHTETSELKRHANKHKLSKTTNWFNS